MPAVEFLLSALETACFEHKMLKMSIVLTARFQTLRAILFTLEKNFDSTNQTVARLGH